MSRSQSLTLPLVAAFFLLYPAAAALAAQVPLGTGAAEPQVAWQPSSNQFLVVTTQYPASGTSLIQGQLFDTGGQPLSAPFIVTQEPATTFSLPVATPHPDGGFVVVYNATGTETTIRVSRVDATGLPFDHRTALRVPGQATQWPVIAYSPTSRRYAIVGVVTSQFPPALSAVVLDDTMNVLAGPFGLTLPGQLDTWGDEAISLVRAPDRDAFVVAYVDDSLGFQTRIGISRFYPDGSTDTGFFVSATNTIDDAPGLVSDPARNRMIVAFRCDPSDDPELCIQGFTFDGLIAPWGVSTPVAALATPIRPDDTQTVRRADLLLDTAADQMILATVADHGNGSEVFLQRIDPVTLSPILPLTGALLEPSWSLPAADIALAAVPGCAGAFYVATFDDGQGNLTTATTSTIALPCPVPTPEPPPPTGVIGVSTLWPMPSTAGLDFGSVSIGTSVTGVIEIRNSGDGTLSIGSIAGNDPLAAPFSMVTDNCSGTTLATTARCLLTLQFTPETTGASDDQFDIPSDASASTLVLWAVHGTGAAVGNQPPAAADLLAPLDGTEIRGPAVELLWASNPDPDGDELVFDLYWCPVSDFSGCDPVRITTPTDTTNAKTDWPLLPLGILVLAGVAAPLRRRPGLVLALLLTMGGCGELRGAFEVSLGTNQKLYAYTLEDIAPGTTLWWKVVAIDPSGASAGSEVWSFTVR